jgi:hypothetical protein
MRKLGVMTADTERAVFSVPALAGVYHSTTELLLQL